MKLTTGIVALAITVGTAAAQNPATILQNTKNSLQDAAQQKTAASNAALQGSAAPAKPSAGTAAKPGAAPAKPATASSQATAKPAAAPVKPAVIPAKTAANSTAKTAPAKAAPASSQAPKVVPAKTAPAANSAVKVVPTKTNPAASTQPAVQVAPAKAAPVPAVKTAVAASKAAMTAPAKAAAPANDKSGAARLAAPAPKTEVKPTAGTEAAKADKPEEKEKDRKYSMTGKRDPFISPVVNRQSGSGCSTGKKCLDIEQVALHGVVKSDNGMIAVVTNGLNKAYFLRENDPVFNGYVLKITVDSIVFKQNFQDRLGKPFTKDVVKRITTPAV
jgi:hypothetical protein